MSSGSGIEDSDSSSDISVEEQRQRSPDSFGTPSWDDNARSRSFSRSRSPSPARSYLRSNGKKGIRRKKLHDDPPRRARSIESRSDEEDSEGEVRLSQRHISGWFKHPAQPSVLPTISQDLTEGQQYTRDQYFASLGSKFGRTVSDISQPDGAAEEFEIPENSRYKPFPPPPPGLARSQTMPRNDSIQPVEGHREFTLADLEQPRVRVRRPQSSTRITRNDNFLQRREDMMVRQQATHLDRSRSSALEPPGLGATSIDRRSKSLVKVSDEKLIKNSRSRPLEDIYEEPFGDTSAHAESATKFHQGIPDSSGRIDWRAQICATLGIDQRASDADVLVAVQKTGCVRPQKPRLEPHFRILYRVDCKRDGSHFVYEDMPYVLDPDSHGNHLRGRNKMSNYDLYVERHQGLSFIVYKRFTCCQRGTEKKPSGAVAQHESTDSISLISRELISALRQAAKTSGRLHLYPEFNHRQEIEAPYLWFFHGFSFLQDFTKRASSKYHPHLRCFFEDYIFKHMVQEYDEVDSMLSRGMISEKYISYLFTPGDVILQRDEKRKSSLYDRAFLQEFWPSKFSVTKQNEDKGSKEEMIRISSKISGLFWEFDGKFCCYKRRVAFHYDTAKGKEFPIQKLPILPLRFADQKDSPRLKARGRKLWECRHQKLVSYSGWDFTQIDHFRDARVMVDMKTYNKIHRAESIRKLEGKFIEELDSNAMEREHPPREEIFYLLMPPNTFGFVMRVRKWHNIMVENMAEVQWEEQAFDSLVMEQTTKDLIKALVTSEIEESKTTDLMSGKGNGLIMLLHGGPGTGKTLTAESVAEYTRKPLYRITSGDIGTNPEAVERYLDVVLDLGKSWDCVVLLDEAEVFLQTRSLTDLARNALVSVFLRVLEYFQGILILTSNRVATFDEAFKSRIQLALHYEPLGKKERKQVWTNFITRLETLDESNVDAADLHKHVDELAAVNMNGRQIRNAVTTARQLAMFKNKTERTRVNFKTLEYIIGVSQKFDSYLSQVNDGLTDEDIARDDKVR
ncbi:hypothetical protein BKA81DRAFT_143339 [Phyllosticta paracitricarpa]|uniref:AAA+ ATPase domain-containing protein n=1 Tax=Phyllosticta citricarpa TaxID=55181 RepID=A0ABR1MJ02_9PEZI